MKSTNRSWQKHLKSKGTLSFFLDRLQSHALSAPWQYEQSPFYFPINQRDLEDELTKSYFEFTEDFPYEIYIETTTSCNLKCKMCARNAITRSHGDMDMKLYYRIIDEIMDKQPYAYVHLYGIGDPMMDQAIFPRLKYANNKGLKNTILFTNGQRLLTDENYQRLAESGLSSIGVDLDGFCQKTYEKIRIGGNFSIAKEGIEKLYGYTRSQNLRTRIEIAYHVYPGINESDISVFVKWCTENDYEYKLVTMHTWAGLRNDVPTTDIKGLLDLHNVQRNSPCPMLWSGLFIGWDGRVGTCFHDADLTDCMGDLMKQTIHTIWHGAHLEKRQNHVNGIFKGLCKGCKTCSNVNLPKFNSPLYPASLRNMNSNA